MLTIGGTELAKEAGRVGFDVGGYLWEEKSRPLGKLLTVTGFLVVVALVIFALKTIQ